jgi:hypothetical protein
MCKHVAAVLYGIGARLDERPELLFLLRSVDQQDLIAKADSGLRPARERPVAAKVLDTGDLSQIFGIEIAQAEPAPESAARRKRTVRDSAPFIARRGAVRGGRTSRKLHWPPRGPTRSFTDGSASASLVCRTALRRADEKLARKAQASAIEPRRTRRECSRFIAWSFQRCYHDEVTEVRLRGLRLGMIVQEDRVLASTSASARSACVERSTCVARSGGISANSHAQSR